MSDDPEARQPVPPAVRGLALPWWRDRASALAAALQGAVEAGSDEGEWKGRRLPVDLLVELAEEAQGQVERLEAEEAARGP